MLSKKAKILHQSMFWQGFCDEYFKFQKGFRQPENRHAIQKNDCHDKTEINFKAYQSWHTIKNSKENKLLLMPFRHSGIAL